MNPVTGVAVAGGGGGAAKRGGVGRGGGKLQLVGWLQQLQRFSAILLIRPVMHNLAEMQDELDKTALRRAVLAALRWKHE